MADDDRVEPVEDSTAGPTSKHVDDVSGTPIDGVPGEGVTGRRPRVETGRRQLRRMGSPRRNVHQVKATDEAERRLVLRAQERGITVSRLLLESALAGGAEAAKTKAELADALYRTNRLLLRIGVNLNQIAAATNASMELQPGTAATLEAVRRVTARVEEILDDLELPADYDRSADVGPGPAVGNSPT